MDPVHKLAVKHRAAALSLRRKQRRFVRTFQLANSYTQKESQAGPYSTAKRGAEELTCVAAAAPWREARLEAVSLLLSDAGEAANFARPLFFSHDVPAPESVGATTGPPEALDATS